MEEYIELEIEIIELEPEDIITASDTRTREYTSSTIEKDTL